MQQRPAAVVPLQKPERTISGAVDVFLAQADLADTTRREYGKHLGRLAGHLGAGRPLAALTAGELDVAVAGNGSGTVGIVATGEARLQTARLRKDEPWFAAAFAALEAIVAGNATDDSWKAIEPFFYGRWDAAAQAHQAAQDGHRNEEAAAAFGAEGAFDPQATRAALAAVNAPVLLLAGEVDLNTIASVVAEFAELFPNAELVVQPGAGHFPWLDDADRFVATTATSLG
jgi:proline iminopeptidase